MCFGVHDGVESGRLAKKPQEVDVYHSEIDDERNDAGCDSDECLSVPGFAAVEISVPWEEALYLLKTRDENVFDFFHLLMY